MISREDIISVISPLNFWGKDQYLGTSRKDYLKQLESSTNSKVISIIGIRRSGKTTLTKQFLSEQIKKGLSKNQTLYVNFEEPKFDPYLGLELLEEIYSSYKQIINTEKKECYIILDEIQNVDKWEKWVRLMQEKRENCNIIITGSSSKMLSSEIATVLTGRTIKMLIYPLSFSEFITFKNLEIRSKSDLAIKKEEILSYLEEYIKYGGFPEIINEKEESKSIILKNYFEDIIYKDIVKRYYIKDSTQAKIAAEISINNLASLISANKLRNILVEILKKKISPNKIVNFLNYFEESQLIFQLSRFSHKIKEQKLYPKKIYCIDTGLANSVTIRSSEDKGKLYENIVAIELKRRGKEIYYWRNEKNLEVDFLIKEKNKVKEIINVSYDLSSPKTMKREIMAITEAMKEFGLSNGKIITKDYEGEKESIKFIPLWKWLLENG